MDKKKGILIISPFFRPNVGGVETHLDDLCKYLKNQRYRVYVLTYQPLTSKAKGLPLELDDNLEIHRISWIGYNLFHKFEPYPLLQVVYLSPLLFVRSFLFLCLNNSKIDLIHVHGLNAAVIGKILKILFKKRLIVSIHAIYGWLYNLTPNSLIAKTAKWIFNSADKILTLCRPSQNELIGMGINAEKISVFTYWVDQNIFRILDKKESKKKLGWDNKFVVLFVGRFIKAKGVHSLLEAAAKLKEEIYFAFVGDGPLMNEIQEAKRNNPKIIYVGKVENKRLPIYYNSADILCVPSQYDEGFGRVILEAMSCGLPVIASKRGAIPDAVGDAGILVEPDVNNLAEAIGSIFKNPLRLGQLIESCKKHAEEKFSLKNADVIKNAYNYGFQ